MKVNRKSVTTAICYCLLFLCVWDKAIQFMPLSSVEPLLRDYADVQLIVCICLSDPYMTVPAWRHRLLRSGHRFGGYRRSDKYRVTTDK